LLDLAVLREDLAVERPLTEFVRVNVPWLVIVWLRSVPLIDGCILGTLNLKLGVTKCALVGSDLLLLQFSAILRCYQVYASFLHVVRQRRVRIFADLNAVAVVNQGRG
jgi:hypothetical protein